ncbi:hypothetical protein N9X25_04480 [Verrucomicrobiales bacterium]|nr:hypothetical protein [Verrucomicrobiales bacterium]
MSGIKKPVVCIDLGATYTKVSWRPEWESGTDGYESPSSVIRIEGQKFTPTLVLESARGGAFFGNTAAGMTPAEGDTLHLDWKRKLFGGEGDAAQQQAANAIGRYLGWLREQVIQSDPSLPLDRARIRLCVPAFDGDEESLALLSEGMAENGWKNSEVFKALEPLSNLIGVCTEGRNWLARGEHFQVNAVFTEMFGYQHPLIVAAREAALQFGQPVHRIAILDIGSFTTDLAVLPWNADSADGFLGGDSRHLSFPHGVIHLLDRTVFKSLSERHGVNIHGLSFGDREELKRAVYGKSIYRVAKQGGGGFVELGDTTDQAVVTEAIRKFIDDLWEHYLKKELLNDPPSWVVVTGGGSMIGRLRRAVRQKFSTLDSNEIPIARENPELARMATALGGSSVILDWLATRGGGGAAPVGQPRPTSRERGSSTCPCRGRNKDCMRCGGRGTYVPKIRKQRKPVGEGNVENQKRKNIQETPAEKLRKEAPAISTETIPKNPAPRSESRLTVDDLRRVIDQEGPKLLNRYTLRGNLGQLVFPDLARWEDRDESVLSTRLGDVSSHRGKIDWYRLLCLGCSLATPVNRTTILNFWREVLDAKDFWQRTIPPVAAAPSVKGFGQEVDAFFDDLIHQEFTSLNASGENAELLRRVFYDFRKMHTFVFSNDLPEVFLEVLEETSHFEAPIRFLKSGYYPGKRPWKGVVGQSMTSPLLFLMRELARIGLIDGRKFLPICFYMNGPARRAARRLGWLDDKIISRFDFDSIVAASQSVHDRMQDEFPEGLDWFDLPLQNLGISRS